MIEQVDPAIWKTVYIPVVMGFAGLLKGVYGVDKKLIPPVVIALCVLGRALLFGGGFGVTNVLWGLLSGITAVGTFSALKNMVGK